MSVHETSPEARLPETDAIIIQFPIGSALSQANLDSEPRAELPSAETMIRIVKERCDASATGADVLILLYETMDFIPKQHDIDELRIAIKDIDSFKAEKLAIQAIQDKEERARLRTNLRNRIKKHGFRIEDVDEDVVGDMLLQTFDVLVEQRAPTQLKIAGLHKRYLQYFYGESKEKVSDASERRENVYDATDGLVQSDPLIELAVQMRKLTHGKGGVPEKASVEFERFTRFKAFEEMQIYTLTEN